MNLRLICQVYHVDLSGEHKSKLRGHLKSDDFWSKKVPYFNALKLKKKLKKQKGNVYKCTEITIKRENRNYSI